MGPDPTGLFQHLTVQFACTVSGRVGPRSLASCPSQPPLEILYSNNGQTSRMWEHYRWRREPFSSPGQVWQAGTMWHGTWERRWHGHLQPEAVVKVQTQQLRSRRE